MKGKDKIKAQVEQRKEAESKVRAEKKQSGVVKKNKGQKYDITDDDLIGYLNENRVGDAKLYSRLFRDSVVFVKYWDRYLVWGGHHWIEDHYNIAMQNIEYVCELYLRLAQNKLDEVRNTKDKDAQEFLKNIADEATRRVKKLRDKPGQDNLSEMLRRIRDPLILLPKYIDKQHYIKACPNGVIDLRTGELRPGRPEDYILNAIETEYDPDLLQLDDPCPETRTHFIILARTRGVG
ncbi:MAG: hypothetical protein IJD16_06615 [Desulfovibrio sp.]|nr:hypothetical protein [Desulfovibrio sp.]